ncbi:hypothetical protein QR98_0099840 [Sarcoptes scabiei]|uniref:Uncharacterized protein n=1 Tax=Sarcoptes scabiei TaxID=52283 RepID=A0A132AKB2_SARSC|nr:hypothetical protein QR98_0099840 [Sarcoptes scabiei]
MREVSDRIDHKRLQSRNKVLKFEFHGPHNTNARRIRHKADILDHCGMNGSVYDHIHDPENMGVDKSVVSYRMATVVKEILLHIYNESR